MDFPSDAMRIGYIKRIVDAGFVNQIVIGQDIACKHLLQKYGGYGYAHLIDNVIPRLVSAGLTQDQVDIITKTNPANVLTFNWNFKIVVYLSFSLNWLRMTKSINIATIKMTTIVLFSIFTLYIFFRAYVKLSYIKTGI